MATVSGSAVDFDAFLHEAHEQAIATTANVKNRENIVFFIIFQISILGYSPSASADNSSPNIQHS